MPRRLVSDADAVATVPRYAYGYHGIVLTHPTIGSRIGWLGLVAGHDSRFALAPPS